MNRLLEFDKRISRTKAVEASVSYSKSTLFYAHLSVMVRCPQAGVQFVGCLFGLGVAFALYDTRNWCEVHKKWEDREERVEEYEAAMLDELKDIYASMDNLVEKEDLPEEVRNFMKLSTAAPRLLDLLKQYHACHRAFSANSNWTSMDEAVRAEAESVIAELDAPLPEGRTIN